MSTKTKRTIEILVGTTVIAAILVFIFSKTEKEIVTIKTPPSVPIIVTVSGDKVLHFIHQKDKNIKEGFNRPSRFLVESYHKQAVSIRYLP